MPLWLSEADVQHSLAMPDLIAAMQPALANFSAGRAVQPVRTVIAYQPTSFFGLMPAYDPANALVGAKLLTVLPGNLAIVVNGSGLGIMPARHIKDDEGFCT